ncbi:MAG: hypothetical protein NXH74_06375 [Rhodobacteraceae bacterium]|jgi:hypothetical protein|nr:hypothetical protein [Paracoccaceae bacterium]
MGILIPAILLSVVLIMAPIAALKNAIGAGGGTSFLSIIGILLCLPLGYGWFTVLSGNHYGSGDGWYEASMVALGLASAFIGTLVSQWASWSARRKEREFQEALRNMETGQPARKRTEPPLTHKTK